MKKSIKMSEKLRSLSKLLENDLKTIKKSQISMNEILHIFHERGFGIILLIFALPMALPIPVPPGLNIVMAFPLLLSGIQISMGRKSLWIPLFIGKKEIQTDKFKNMIEKTLPFLKKMEVLLKPRLKFMTSGLASNLNGLCILIMALAICIPVPLSNTIPSFGIVLISLGTLTRDGIAILLGILIGIIWIVILTLAYIYLGEQGFAFIKESIQSLL